MVARNLVRLKHRAVLLRVAYLADVQHGAAWRAIGDAEVVRVRHRAVHVVVDGQLARAVLVHEGSFGREQVELAAHHQRHRNRRYDVRGDLAHVEEFESGVRALKVLVELDRAGDAVKADAGGDIAEGLAGELSDVADGLLRKEPQSSHHRVVYDRICANSGWVDSQVVKLFRVWHVCQAFVQAELIVGLFQAASERHEGPL
mmetsp:Transcript_20084/g.64304  ORF Transcript_20084/g.64304 Transcript_20084/m.64304 type:complete len:202 (+) Transcript_20084:864-1469(+)